MELILITFVFLEVGILATNCLGAIPRQRRVHGPQNDFNGFSNNNNFGTTFTNGNQLLAQLQNQLSNNLKNIAQSNGFNNGLNNQFNGFNRPSGGFKPTGNSNNNNNNNDGGIVFIEPVDRPASRPISGQNGGQNSPSTARPRTTTTTTTPATEASQNSCEQNCPTTPEYNPICGTDGVVYTNPGKLGCARRCGKSVELRHYGTTCSATSGS